MFKWLVPAVVLALASAGCLAGLTNEGAPCQLGRHVCTATADGWLLEDVTLEGDVDLVLRSGPVLSIVNVTITGADRVDLNVLCACTIRGENFVVEGLGPDTYGVWLQAGQGSWTELEDGVRLDGITVSNLARGILVGPSLGVTTISNATIACPPGGDAVAADFGLHTKLLRIHDSTTTGCASVHLIQRSEEPGILRLEVERSHLQGGGPDVPDGISTSAGNPSELRFLNSSISNVRYAFNLDESQRLILRNSTVSESRTAISMSAGSHARLENAVLERNIYAVRAWDGARLEATGSRFIENGRPPLNDCEAAVSGQLTGWIHDSAFEGNYVALDVYPMGFDATNNYWGAPTGPVPFTGCAVRTDAVQQVASGVSFVPFLTEQP